MIDLSDARTAAIAASMRRSFAIVGPTIWAVTAVGMCGLGWLVHNPSPVGWLAWAETLAAVVAVCSAAGMLTIIGGLFILPALGLLMAFNHAVDPLMGADAGFWPTSVMIAAHLVGAVIGLLVSDRVMDVGEFLGDRWS